MAHDAGAVQIRHTTAHHAYGFARHRIRRRTASRLGEWSRRKPLRNGTFLPTADRVRALSVATVGCDRMVGR